MGVYVKKSNKLEIIDDGKSFKEAQFDWIIINIGSIVIFLSALLGLNFAKQSLWLPIVAYIISTPLYLYERKEFKEHKTIVIIDSKNIEIYQKGNFLAKGTKKIISLSNIEYMIAKAKGKEHDIYNNTIILKQKEASSKKEMYVKFSIPEMSVNEFLKIFNEFTDGGKKDE